LQPQSITRRLFAAAAVIAACTALLAQARAPAAVEQLADFRPTPEFLSLFTPRLHRAAYRTFVSPLSIGDVLRRLGGDPLRMHPPGSWEPKATLPFDAFGESGTYDRFRLARLYGAARAMVARGPRGAAGVATESWTLISPYPDPDLARLQPGTLLIVLTVPER
jgi:hypothetical protein